MQKVVEPEELMPTAEAMAQKIASNAPVAVMALQDPSQQGLPFDLFSGCALEAEKVLAYVSVPKNQKEGMKAFLNKTKYEYQGK